MKKPAKPPRKVKVSVLMPPPLRDMLIQRAQRNLRSLSSEVVAILQFAAV